MSTESTFTTIGRLETTLPIERQLRCDSVLTKDFIVELSSKETLDIFSKSASFVKLNKKILSTCL
jgi:hypothetical protein